MSTQHIEHLIKALGLPFPGHIDLEDQTLYRQIVFELEDKWIAAMDREERKQLKNQSNYSQWCSVFEQYLKELKCPIKFASKQGQNKAPILEWLLQVAVSDEFNESGLAKNHTPLTSSQPSSDVFTDWDSDGTESLIQELQGLLKISHSSSDLPKRLQEIKAAVEDQAQAATLSTSSDTGAEILRKQTQNLGFSSGDEQVDTAATLMRILFIKDLRELQSQVDSAIVRVQEFTKNPRTNAKLGLVGR